MKAVLDHVGIAVDDLAAALAFFRDALGLEVRAPEEVAGQRVRAHVVPVGGPALELLEATAPEACVSSIASRARGPKGRSSHSSIRRARTACWSS